MSLLLSQTFPPILSDFIVCRDDKDICCEYVRFLILSGGFLYEPSIVMMTAGTEASSLSVLKLLIQLGVVMVHSWPAKLRSAKAFLSLILGDSDLS